MSCALRRQSMPLRRQSSPHTPPPILPPPTLTTFYPFPKLPVELQVIIFKELTAEWMLEELPNKFATSHPFGAYLEVNKSPLEWIADDKGCGMPVEYVESFSAVLPSMLWVCRLARGVAYDTLIYQRLYSEKVVWAAGPLDLYVESYYGPSRVDDDGLWVLDYGLRIQDFRRSGLEVRVREEERRIEQSIEESKWKEKSPWVDGVLGPRERRGKAQFFMLPGNGHYWLYEHE